MRAFGFFFFSSSLFLLKQENLRKGKAGGDKANMGEFLLSCNINILERKNSLPIRECISTAYLNVIRSAGVLPTVN